LLKLQYEVSKFKTLEWPLVVRTTHYAAKTWLTWLLSRTFVDATDALQV